MDITMNEDGAPRYSVADMNYLIILEGVNNKSLVAGMDTIYTSVCLIMSVLIHLGLREGGYQIL